MNATLLGPVISAVAAFLGVLVGTALIPWLRSRGARKRAARFLAIRVVCVLDKYLEACASVATDWGEENKDGATESRVSEPRAPVYPSDLDWHSIEYTLMYRLMMLQTLAERGASMVRAAGEVSDPPDFGEYFEARCFEYGTLGLKAFELSQALRGAFNIPDLERSEWNPVERINAELEELKERRKKRADWSVGVPL